MRRDNDEEGILRRESARQGATIIVSMANQKLNAHRQMMLPHEGKREMMKVLHKLMQAITHMRRTKKRDLTICTHTHSSPAMLKIRLVPRKRDNHVRVSSTLQLLYPRFRPVKRLL